MKTTTLIFFISLIFISSCQKDLTDENSSNVSLPTLTTSIITSLSSATAVSGGNITPDGGAAITGRGVCWATTINPNITGNHTSDGTGTGLFISNITGLSAGITYYTRAYATNSAGTVYGNEVSFIASNTNVYIAGYESVAFKGIAKFWKNGVVTNLSTGGSDAVANSVFVSGSDVYVAGTENNIAKVWKNGVATSLTSGVNAAGTTSVYILGSDLYAAIIENNPTPPLWRVAKVWKNGIFTSLTNGTRDAFAKSVFVSGSDVYVAGYEHNGTNYVAKIWKNGISSALTDGTRNAYAESIFISGSDVYVAGSVYNGTNGDIPTLWKNGVATSLPGLKGRAHSVFVAGSDVYVAGYEETATKLIAMVWKNGVPTALSSGTNSAFAASIYIFGADLYVAGYINNGTNDVATFWKNGVPTALTNGINGSIAYSIFVTNN